MYVNMKEEINCDFGNYEYVLQTLKCARLIRQLEGRTQITYVANEFYKFLRFVYYILRFKHQKCADGLNVNEEIDVLTTNK